MLSIILRIHFAIWNYTGILMWRLNGSASLRQVTKLQAFYGTRNLTATFSGAYQWSLSHQMNLFVLHNIPLYFLEFHLNSTRTSHLYLYLSSESFFQFSLPKRSYIKVTHICQTRPRRDILVSIASIGRSSRAEVAALVSFSIHMPKLYKRTKWPVCLKVLPILRYSQWSHIS